MKKILLVGKNSFIASKLFFSLPIEYIVDRIPHDEIESITLNNYNLIINCALHPLLRTSAYNEDLDIDSKIAKNFKGHFITFSSRKVYGSNNDLLTYTEDSPVNPNDYYSFNKVIVENKIRSYCEKYTILRASNVFGFEYGRNSFMGFLMKQLKTNNDILLDISPYTVRDFISVDDVAYFTHLTVDKKITGVYNLSSGVGELIGNVAKYLTKGYRSGDVLAKSKIIKDQFILANEKILNALEIDIIDFNYENEFKLLGEQLCKI